MAVTKDQKTIRYGTPDGHQPTAQPVKAAAQLYAGTIALTASGYAKSAATVASTDICWGLYNGLLNGTPTTSTPITGGSTDGAVVVGIDTGSFYLQNGTNSDAITQADVGALCYVIDEVTVGKTNGSSSRPVAGRIMSIGTAQYAGMIAVLLGNNQTTGSP